MPSEQETFLVVVQGSEGSFCQAFLWQGTYEDVYKIKHDLWDVSVFLLMPEEPQAWSGYGTQLLRVVDIHAVHKASQLVERALFHLSRLAPAQQSVELAAIQGRLRVEERQAAHNAYSDTPEGNRQRLADLGIQPLSDEEIQDLRRK